MMELGYMAKRIVSRPDWLGHPEVRDIFAVADCISDNFCNYINFWKHNGFWFFDSVKLIREVAAEAGVSLSDTTLVYYRGYERQYDADLNAWTEYSPNPGFQTGVSPPHSAALIGYDIVTYSMQNAPECSPLSCNYLAADVRVNEHCLIDSLDDAITCLENGVFNSAEPGPYRIIGVHALDWPRTG